jgi:hypothetical protein
LNNGGERSRLLVAQVSRFSVESGRRKPLVCICDLRFSLSTFRVPQGCRRGLYTVFIFRPIEELPQVLQTDTNRTKPGDWYRRIQTTMLPHL